MFSLIWAWINGWVNNRHQWHEMPPCSLWRHCNDWILLGLCHYTVMSYKHYGISNHLPLDCLFNSWFRLTAQKNKAPHYWPYHQSMVDSPHKEAKRSLTWKMLPSHNTILTIWSIIKQFSIHCGNGPISLIPECICSIFHNAIFRTKCAPFCSEWSLVGHVTGAFGDLWIRSIARVEYKSHFALTQNIPYFDLTGKLYSVYCENLREI